ncbi:MAG: lipid A biosynthesis (KDO)2-(lauroyl)-lipid IVA acyltransferase [Bacteroidales bacterium]
MTEHKWQGKTSGGNFWLNALMFLMRNVSINLTYIILYLVIPFYMLFRQKGYKAIYCFFRKRFGYSPWKSLCNTYRNHYIFGQTLLDKFAVFAGKRNLFEFNIEGYEHYIDAENLEKGILFAGAHVGNFEILGYFLKANKKPINGIVFGGETAIIQTNRNNIFKEQKLTLIPINKKDLSHIFLLSAAAERGEIISVLCDRYMEGNKKINVDFLGTKANFPLGTFMIANRYELTVLVIFAIKESYKKYKVIINKIEGTSAKELAQKYTFLLEQMVKMHPNQWFNFYDFFDEKK